MLRVHAKLPAAVWTRRRLMSGLLGAAVMPPLAQGAAGASPRRIDVHTHLIPPEYRKEAPDGATKVTPWSPELLLEEMDRNGIATSMLSFSTPHRWHPGQEAARRLARMCNDYSAALVRERPTRFGALAGLPPLPDTEGCLNEIRYAFDALKADGVTVMTSYGVQHLGHSEFAPVWDELNRRAAVVYVHPSDASCCANPSVPALGEGPFDTARTVMSLLMAGTFVRWPRIKFIFSHGGGATPMLLDRLDKIGRPPGGGPEPAEQLKTLYFDTAQAASAPVLAALQNIVDTSHILFGTDYPYNPAERVVRRLATAKLNAEERRAIDRNNALALFPRLAKLPEAASILNGPWSHRAVATS